MGKLAFHLVYLIGVEVGVLDGLKQLVVDLGVLYCEAIGAVLVEQGYRGAVRNGATEVIHRHVSAERAGGQLIIGQKRRSGKAHLGGRRQQPCHVLGKDAIVRAMRLVGEHHDVVVGQDGLGIGLIELLDEREDISRVAPELLRKVGSAGRAAARGGYAGQASAALERLADLFVQLVAVGQHQEGG